MRKQDELWQSFLKELGLSQQEANAWQGYVITVNAPQQLGLTRMETEMGMIEGPLAGSLILRLAGKPSPCQFRPLAGAISFFQLSPSDCESPIKADTVYGWWLAFEGSHNPLSAADYNNVGCAAMWKQPPDENLARQMFKKALKRDDSIEIINQNLQLLDSPRPKPLPVARETIVKVLQDKTYDDLLHWEDDTTVMLGVINQEM